ncbi:MAG: hypothetical protein ACR2PC_11520 [Tsuneonella suprasediminis]|nr:hypothetical protein LBX01_11875 [Altererythrobacter sp. N1]
MKRTAICLCLTALAAGGCSKSNDASTGEGADDYAARAGVSSLGANDAGASSVAEVNAQPVLASEGSTRLMPLASDAPMALGKVAGGCSFIYQGRSLLVAGSENDADDKGKGVLVIDGRQLMLPGVEAGGLQVIESGPILAGDGFTVSVLRGEGEPSRANGKSEWGADLRVKGPTGETTFSQGKWSCTA